MAEKINKIIIEIDGEEYEFDGGGGGHPGPHSVGHDELKGDSVGTDNIIDGAVQMEDLHDDVKGKMTNTYNKGNETLTLGSLNVTQAATQPTTPTQPMVVEEEEEP